MATYRRKPIYVDAVQFDPTQPWPEGVDARWDSKDRARHPFVRDEQYLFDLNPGDWIITHQTQTHGRVNVLGDEQFRELYDAVDVVEGEVVAGAPRS